MAEIPLDIKLSVRAEAVRKALKGVQREVEQIEAATRKELQKTDDLRRRSLRMQKNQAAELGKAFHRLGSGIERELQASIFTGAKRGIQRAKQFLSGRGGAALWGAIGAGAVVGARAVSRSLQLTNAPSTEQRLNFATTFRNQFLDLQTQTGKTNEEMQALQNSIIKTSNASLIASDVLLQGFAQSQEAFDRIDFISDNFDVLSRTSKALSIHFPDLVNTVGVLVDKMGVASIDVPEVVGLLIEAEKQGALSIEEFGGTLAEIIPSFRAITGLSGVEGTRRLVATTQVLSQGGAPQGQAEALLRTFLDPKKSRAAARFTGSAPGDIEGLARGLAGKSDADIRKRLKPIFGDDAAVQAALTLRDQYQRDPRAFDRISRASGQAGLDIAEKGFQRKISDPLIRSESVAISSLNLAITNMDGLAESATELAKPISDLRSKLPRTTEVFKDFSRIVGAIGGGQFLLKAIETKSVIGGVTGTVAPLAPLAPPAAIAAVAGGSSFGGNVLLERQFEKIAAEAGGGITAEDVRKKRADFLGMGKELSIAVGDLQTTAQNLSTATAPVGKAD